MKYFVKLSIEGSFPSGVENTGTYEIPEKLHNQFISLLAQGMVSRSVKKV